MCAPAEIVHARRNHRSPPARYLRVVKLVVVFSAALTFLTLFDSSTGTDGELIHRFLKEKVKKEMKVEKAKQGKEAEKAKKGKNVEKAKKGKKVEKAKKNKPKTQRRTSLTMPLKTKVEKKKKKKPKIFVKDKKVKKEKKVEKAKKKMPKTALTLEQVEAKKRKHERAIHPENFRWTETTEAFLPVLTKDAFKLYVDTFRSALFCFHENGLNLIPTGGTLVGALRHKGMIPWDDDIDVYYFAKDQFAIFDPNSPVRKCLEMRGIQNSYYRGNGGPSNKNIRFTVHGQHMLSAFPAYIKEHKYLDHWSGPLPVFNSWYHIDFVSQNIEKRRSPMLQEDVFPLTKYPFHDYHVYLPHNIEKYLEVDWGKNQVDKIKTPTYASLMSTVVSGHLHRGCKRAPMKANITDVQFLQYYDPEDYLNSLPFRSGKCHGRFLEEYGEYVQARFPSIMLNGPIDGS